MTEKEDITQRLNYFYQNGYFDKYYEQLKCAKTSYKVYRNDKGEHKLELKFDFSDIFGNFF